MIDNILFDLDGTLADTAPDLANALNAIRLKHGFEKLPLETISPTVSLGGNAMIKLAFDLEEGQSGFDGIRDQFLNHYLENIAEETKLYAGIEEVLQSIEDNNKTWGIVTNKSSWLTIPLLEALSLDKRAACVVSGDTLEHRKPHPAPILHACKLINAEPASTIYIGDAQRDIEAGRRAGTKTLAALYGYIDKDEDTNSWDADATVSSAHEINDKLCEF
ncbi:MAG TPA: HAD family hydrolase [Thiotrichaceae bacterium]|jgi:phosphoglycolate phosphatase|nr:HAD family hydrolase [Thiotrichaceae bacterium]HIM09006.1 HAD family hydrolase [Gammaproteobacteria bacterium]